MVPLATRFPAQAPFAHDELAETSAVFRYIEHNPIFFTLSGWLRISTVTTLAMFLPLEKLHVSSLRALDPRVKSVVVPSPRRKSAALAWSLAAA
jgi:hypothetical protein